MFEQQNPQVEKDYDSGDQRGECNGKRRMLCNLASNGGAKGGGEVALRGTARGLRWWQKEVRW